MSQVSDVTLSNQGFSAFRTELNNILGALNSMHSGTSRPASATTGTMWLDSTNSGSNSLEIKFFDGSDDISVATIDTSANTINFLDSVVTGINIVTDTSPQLGGVLDTNGNNIEFGDSSGAEVERLKFGAGDDMEIFHDGTNSVILEQGGGDLHIQNNANFEILNEAGNEAKAKFITDGAVELYHNNVKKIETTASGVTVTGTVNTDQLDIGNHVIEDATISATASTGTINFDVNTQSVLFFTTNATANFTLNVRGDASTTLNSIMAIGDAMTIVFLSTQGSSAYFNNVFKIDGTTITPKFQGGSAPSSGNANSVDSYVYSIFKTADATFTVFGSQTQFA
tara:strand:- start:1706 stop:2725 length:1020 start_codon:yes stop_codon:yes gene_type:complete